ncbi:WXG100 family type VII secretion target [Mycobacterium simiae]|uniref:WXG100 family type VII secretion target n=1 Tax=Mycobacterium simiae TaxID=1784 RepID=UPI000427857B|nr:hypothetical protein [Mycobacterium simiae]PLV49384.1 hypothetical protein X011_14960 [Mycobacterium tuberculosis variant microti OV254]
MPSHQSAQTSPGADPGPIINASESDLGDYLNQPVQNILAQLGVPPLPQPAPPSDAPPPAAPPPGATGNQMTGMLTSLLTQMIQPVTDALGMLGPGVFSNLDPSQMLSGISNTLGSAAQLVQPAMANVAGAWQGDAATAAMAQTSAALTDGTQVSSQATALSNSLSTAAASVQQAQSQLIAILNQFSATIAAIGPNIIFPWGIAQAIAAANQAVTMSTAVMTELQGSLGTESANTTAVGAPVSLSSARITGPGLATAGTPSSAATAVSGLGTNLLAAPGAAASAPAAAGSAPASAFTPLVQAVAMPAMEGVGAATSAMQGAGAGAGVPTPSGAPGASGGPSGLNPGAGRSGAGGGGGAGIVPPSGVPLETIQSRLSSAPTVPVTDAAPEAMSAGALSPPPMSGAPMMGGAPMAGGARASAGRSHTAAAFLHTSDQGDEIVGDLGSVAPAVIGQPETVASPDIELRI